MGGMVSNAAMTHSASLPPFRVALQSAGIGQKRTSATKGTQRNSGMGWGKIYEVADDVNKTLVDCKTKTDWYGALGTFDLERAPHLDAEDSIRFWGSKLQEIVHPGATFFVGELHAEYDGSDDPNVCFNGSKSVRAFLSQLDELGRNFFDNLFPHNGPFGSGESWLYEPLCDFLRKVSSRDNAVILLWEN